MNDKRQASPTYRIPAREVVPGMIYQGSRLHGMPWDHCQIAGDKLVTVQLPGPSPRELACTCCPVLCSECLDLGAFNPKTADVIGKPCERPGCRGTYKKGRVAGADPQQHVDCLVAPVPSRHSGMRLWPAPWRGAAWSWDSTPGTDRYLDGKGRPQISTTGLRRVSYGIATDRDWADAMLQCFFLPPVPQPERRPTPAWDPYGTDLDLAVHRG